ncbi:putative N-acetyltransferase (TIGR04045 family) [Angulomicrobium tetraedrale]|uniref:Putative N-acetyltransferase (TIGR04045 family) n=1 Tax=Ancylobacter tetraedralis TaxID=217068 RepID=A0A839Z685_9HYPH|nr:MSMEG_0567/Sll0786 family nitrogen starvation N-acetyltransferase [Ancylobacter tetraedralis]MBB3770543.1 putative N-acetyltransferase (TIGR04045 family) [Ancylobacter tetraedralis]
MMFEPVRPFIAADFQVKFATATWERRCAAQLRRQVFCAEQGLFGGRDDRDSLDDVAIPIVALSMLGVMADDVVGTVRIHEAEPGTWWGSRLAVAEDYRKVGALGAALIRLAVSSAHARGCTRFLAHVQSQNSLLFRRLHWNILEETELHGRAHVLMQADLAFYPPIADAETGFHAQARSALAGSASMRRAA